MKTFAICSRLITNILHGNKVKKCWLNIRPRKESESHAKGALIRALLHTYSKERALPVTCSIPASLRRTQFLLAPSSWPRCQSQCTPHSNYNLRLELHSLDSNSHRSTAESEASKGWSILYCCYNLAGEWFGSRMPSLGYLQFDESLRLHAFWLSWTYLCKRNEGWLSQSGLG